MPDSLMRRAGVALYGRPHWAAYLAADLGVRVETVKNMAKGHSRVPPNLWRDVAGLLRAEGHRALAAEAEQAALTTMWHPGKNGDRLPDPRLK